MMQTLIVGSLNQRRNSWVISLIIDYDNKQRKTDTSWGEGSRRPMAHNIGNSRLIIAFKSKSILEENKYQR